MEIGKKIANIRKENNLTQEEFAEKYNVSRQTISSWENGKSYPDLTLLVKISNDFDISLDKLLKEDKKIIETLSKYQNDNKKYKKILKNILIIFCIISILVLGYILIYNTSKYILDNKFNKILSENNFYKNNEFSYSLIYDDNITYNVPSEIDINKTTFKYNSKILTCTFEYEKDKVLYIVWNEHNHYGILAYNQNTMIELFNIDLSEEKTDKIKFIIDNTSIDEEIIKKIINKGNDLYTQFYN